MAWAWFKPRRQSGSSQEASAAPIKGVPAAPADASLAASTQRLAHFEIEALIGSGATGRVFRARDLHSGRAVALKTIALGAGLSGHALDEARGQLRRETEAARRLQHPDIVEVLEVGEAGPIAYVAMELLSGCDLRRFTGPDQLLPPSTVLHIGGRAAGALAHAHARGVVHRDIKPANVMVDFDLGQVKLTDFGIARVSDAVRTRTGLVLGTPLYMAPEQIAGRAADGRSDLYALGVMLFQLLCGRLPSEARSMAEVIQHAAHPRAHRLRTYRPELPTDLDDVVTLCLQQRPDLRYARAEDLADDLALVNSRWFGADPPSHGSALRRT